MWLIVWATVIRRNLNHGRREDCISTEISPGFNIKGYWIMDYEQDDESGTFTLRIKSRSGESIYSFTEAWIAL